LAFCLKILRPFWKKKVGKHHLHWHYVGNKEYGWVYQNVASLIINDKRKGTHRYSGSYRKLLKETKCLYNTPPFLKECTSNYLGE
jgi:hypothetical protein